MIKEYYRPQNLEEALKLLTQTDTLPLGGGTLLSKPGPDPFKVVDLQALGLNTIQKKGTTWRSEQRSPYSNCSIAKLSKKR